MQRASPAQEKVVNESLLRSEAAGDELKICYEADKKMGKEQRCNVLVKLPTR